MERKILKTITMIDTSVSAGSGWHTQKKLTYRWLAHPIRYLTHFIIGQTACVFIYFLAPHFDPLILLAIFVGAIVGIIVLVFTQDEPRRFPTWMQTRLFVASAADRGARLQLKYCPYEDEFGDIVPTGCTLQCKCAGEIYSLDLANYTIVVDANCASDICGLDYANRTLIVSGP